MATEIVHNQRFMTLFHSAGRVLGGAFVRGLGFAVAFSVLSTLAAITLVETPIQAQAPVDWAVFLVPLVVLIFFQAVGEELIFRGEEIATAIGRYQARNGNALPPSLEVLVKGKFLRREYKDPMTKHGRWRFIRPGDRDPGEPRCGSQEAS